MVAGAQPVTGLYMGAGVGVNLLQQENIDSVTFPDGNISGAGKLQSHPGPVGILSIGWGLGNGLRFEAEADYRANKFYQLTESGNPVAAAGGLEQKFGPMFNVLYDFVGIMPVFQPYVGLGAGYQWAFEQNTNAYGGGESINLGTASKGNFAYQAIVGMAMPISAAPGLAITAEYRFMGLAGNRDYSGVATSAGVGSVPVSVKLNNNYNNTFLVGFRYNFGQAAPVAPAPAAAPAPAVQPARSYLVFFDWDKANLTDRARQIIKEAADNSTHVQYTRIEVNGYTDTSGTPQYNMGLSVRRATAVKAELIKDGVPAAAIATQGFGETHLLVPTGAGVREPQNRRVEIIIH
jgi:outer membrane protein OmpA-like peptidoglycan-associated protein